jgi:hypothetical protein
VPHLRVSGKGGKTRYLPLHPGTHALIHDYLDAAGHGTESLGDSGYRWKIEKIPGSAGSYRNMIEVWLRMK